MSCEFESHFLHQFIAEIAQLVEHNLAKVRVASSSLVFRSFKRENQATEAGSLFFFLCIHIFLTTEYTEFHNNMRECIEIEVPYHFVIQSEAKDLEFIKWACPNNDTLC